MWGALMALYLAQTAFAGGHSKKDLVEIAVGAGPFQTLVVAIKVVAFVDLLKRERPGTVFAPADNAFKVLPEDTSESLLKLENKDQLTAILTYHVRAGKIMAPEIVYKKLEVTMVNVATAEIDATDGVKTEGPNVVQADIKTSNGVIHGIDAVISL